MAIISEEQSKVGLDPTDDRHVSNWMCTFFHYPDLAKGYFPFLKKVLYEGVLRPRHRELAILRVAWLRQAEYAWGKHVKIGRAEGLADDEIRRVTRFDPDEWDQTDAHVIRAAEELVKSAYISEEVWNALMPSLGVESLWELIFAVGNYDMLAMFMKSAQVELEDDLGAMSLARVSHPSELDKV